MKTDIVVWNGLRGEAKSALEFLYRMCKADGEPNSTTVSVVLVALCPNQGFEMGKGDSWILI